MSLSSVGNPAWDTIRGVRFAMLHGPTLVTVLVTHEAVDDVEKATAGDGGPLARFNKHRDRFEQAASAKHQRGKFEEDGLVIVDVADLKCAAAPVSDPTTPPAAPSLPSRSTTLRLV